MGVDSGAYDTVMVLHIMCVIIGFGGVFLNAIYGAEAKRRQGSEGLAVFEATERVGKVAEVFILAVPVFGISLVLMSHSKWAFSQTWVAAGLAIYAVALTLSFGFHLPNLKRMGGLMHELVAMAHAQKSVAGGAVPTEDEHAAAAIAAAGGPPPQVIELQRCGKLAGIYGGTLNLAIIAVVILMVWKPGS
ncbi:MAG TPA: hypothetical protein VKR22_12675 [Acidimicrobiales bacterium]|nr:hypothetical protein [Acidimicrobiales bacterium]